MSSAPSRTSGTGRGAHEAIDADEAAVGGTGHGEVLSIDERLIVAPAAGTFHASLSLVRGDALQRGEVVGSIDNLGAKTVVTSQVAGVVDAVFASSGERVHLGDRLVWVRSLCTNERDG